MAHITSQMENHMGKNMENYLDSGTMQGFQGGYKNP